MSLLKNISSLVWRFRLIVLLIVGIGVLFGVQIMFRMSATPDDGISVDIKEKAKSNKFRNYDQAIVINSTSYVIIPVVLDTSRLEKNNISFKESYSENENTIINYLFINKYQNEKRKLFESDIQILSSNIEPENLHDETTETILQPKILIYQVVVKDTNNDKLLNDKDYSSLFISDLDGKNLKQVTPEKRYIDYYIDDQKASRIVIGLHDDKKLQQVMIFNYKTGKSIHYNL